jgi:hypothetical protein
MSALHTTSFYGQPLVSWTPALGAEAYEVQWSKTQYPFNPELTAAGAAGFMTAGTSAVLPVTAGTWWYRVRGFDYSLPTGAQQMSWSDPAKLVVAQPKFKIVAGTTTGTSAKKKAVKTVTTTALRTAAGAGFTMSVPTNWTVVATKDSLASFAYVNAKTRSSVNVLSSSGRAGRTMAQWEGDLKSELATATGASPTATLVTLPAGSAVRLTLSVTSGGKTIDEVQYAVDAGNIAYTVTFGSLDANYKSDAGTFAKMIASFKLS